LHLTLSLSNKKHLLNEINLKDFNILSRMELRIIIDEVTINQEEVS